MKNSIKIGLLSLVAIAGCADAGDMKASLMAYSDCHPELSQMKMSDRPQQCAMSTQSLTFMIKGKNIAVIDKDSLRFSKLTVGGADVRFNRKGEETFKLGSFPKVDDDGQFAIFDVNIQSAPFGHISSASVAGTVDVFTSERLINDEKTKLDSTKAFSMKVGPLVVSNSSQPIKPKDGVLGEMGEAFSEGLKTAFTGDDQNRLTLYVTGDLNTFVALEAYENGRKLEPGWSSWSGSERTLTFAKPVGNSIDLKVKYWDGVARVTVPIAH
jgi:hypothetical protein